MVPRFSLSARVLVGFLTVGLAAPSLTAAEPPRVTALKDARVVLAPGRVLEKATIVVRKGVIVAVGPNIAIPSDAVVHDLTGRTVYPGLIDAHVTLSRLSGKRDAPADDDDTPAFGPRRSTTPAAPATGNVHPSSRLRAERRAVAEVVLKDEVKEQLRGLGFTTVNAVPDRGIFRGRSAVLSLGDGSVAKNVVLAREAQVVASDLEADGEDRYPNSKMGATAVIRQTILDARWLRDAEAAFAAGPANKERPERIETWAALGEVIQGKETVAMETPDVLELLRSASLAKELGLRARFVGGSDAYRLLPEVVAAKPDLVLSLAFPAVPTIADDDEWRDVPLSSLQHWDRAPSNPRWLKDAGLTFSLTTHGLPELSDLESRIRKARARGLSEETVLAAFTTVPAKQLGLEGKLGEIAAGRAANLVITDGPLFAEKTRVLETWVDGTAYEAPRKRATLPGVFALESGKLEIKADRRAGGFGVTVTPQGGTAVPASAVSRHENELRFTIDGGAFGVAAGPVQAAALVEGDELRLDLRRGLERLSKVGRREERPDRPGRSEGDPEGGDRPERTERTERTEKAEKPDSDVRPAPPRFAGPLALPRAVLVKNATIYTAGPSGILQGASLLVVDGRIVSVGTDLKVPPTLGKDVTEIDAQGRWVTPGLVDCHSHTAIDGSVNEFGNSITAEVRVTDVQDPFDVAIYRELAGGLTTVHSLHGSANAIGGQDDVKKLKWGETGAVQHIPDAVPGIKFALGENPKRSNAQATPGSRPRYPQTRMGVSAQIRERFAAAQDYRRKQKDHEAAKKRGESPIPPRPNLQLEAIAEILEGTRLIHSHAYVKQEMLDLLRICEEFGVKIATFQHTLEGYKIADEIAAHGAGASSFSDWWSYKFEVFDSIPYNGALMRDRGVLVSFNSDSDELARRMSTEAAKAVKYGGVPREKALELVTINAAKQLRLEKRIGSLEAGKDGDFVIWSADPLSPSAVAQETWIEGKKYFDRLADLAAREGLAAEKLRLIAAAKVAEARGEARGPSPERPRAMDHHCMEGLEDGIDSDEVAQ